MSKIKILTIDGGGTRGIIPATLLDLVFKETNKHPTEIFDLLAGTSTGGILCTAYAHGVATDELVDLYLNKSGQIFYDSVWDDIRDGFGKNLGADYSNKEFAKILNDIFKQNTLKDLNDKLGPNKGLMVCSFELYPKEEGKPENFKPKVFHSSFIRDAWVKLTDLCLMTSAGPTYFPIYQGFIDGGVSLNNPSMAAIAYAINENTSDSGKYRYPDGSNKGLSKGLKDIKLFSLGCGTSNKNYIKPTTIKKKRKGDWGNIQWIEYLPDLITETNVQATAYYVDQLLPSNSYKRVQLYFDKDETPRILRNKNLGLDVKNRKYLNAMKQYAEQTFEKEKGNILNFLGLI